MGPSGCVRSWPRFGLGASPFKAGRRAALRDLLPGGDSPLKIKVDIAHTYAICGFGKDDLASCIVFLSIRAKIWGNGTMDHQLDCAFDSFKDWCIQNKKTTSILDFSKQELKIKSFFDRASKFCLQDVYSCS